MTDHKVLVFGSFTDNEIKSLQRHPTENDVEIRFGSLDSATLKSVGLFNTIPRDLERSKGFRLSKLVNGKNAIDTPKEIESPILATTSDEKGSIHNSSPLSGSDGVKELKTNNNVEPSVSCLSGNVSDPLIQSSPKQNGTEDVNISSEPPKEIESPILATTSDEKGSIHNSSPLSGSDGVKELKTNNNVESSVSCLSGNVSDPLNQSSPKQNGTEDVNISSEPLKNEASIDSSQVLDLVDAKENILKASNGPSATIGNLLPRGFVNLGNLCFLNATLQALLSCSPFVHLLQELRTHNMPQIGYPTLRAFVEFISDFDTLLDSSSKKKEAVLETGRPLRPVMFESVLKIFSPDVPNNLSGWPRQEDAQEFLSFIMHQMHDELLKLESQFSNGNGEKTSLVSSMNGEDDDDNWETVGPKNKTAITRTQSFIPSKLSAIFGGQLRSVVKARGNKASATIQPFLLLPLNICPEQVCTIEDALRLFSAQETLEGYRASAAGKAEVVSASKSVKISELPEIMILHLVRFSYGSQGSTKLHKPVRFPLELVLGRELLVSPSSEGRRYELVATITHHGRDPSKGHYTADSRHFPSGKWLRYDDAAVTPIPTSKVLHDQAYVLFYRHL